MLYYSISLFIIGLYLGNLYTLIGYKLPNKKIIRYPSFNCNCKNYLVLLPIISYFILKGECNKCNRNIIKIYPIMELLTGFLFLISYILFGLTLKYLLVITFISCLLITIVSDYYYMIICDEILIIFSIILLIEIYFINGLNELIYSLICGLISFIVMFIIKKIGDFLFKRESMGGGDIKLLFIFGLVLKLPLSLFAIFLGSIIALPISIINLIKNTNHEIPFGPFLSISSIVLLLFNSQISKILIKLLF